MNADDITLQGILDSPFRYIMPPYQRFFTWAEAQVAVLWRDIAGLVNDGGERRHFMGALVFVAVPHCPGSDPVLRVVDGQQRLLTLSLLFCALRNVARSHSLGSLADEIEETYLVNPYQTGREHLRIYPRHRDRAEYEAAVEGDRAPTGKIGKALRYFAQHIREDILAPVKVHASDTNTEGEEDQSDEDAESRLRLLLAVLKGALDFVHISLDDESNAYQTFQSLDSTGVDLAQSDLIRCEVMAHVPTQRQDAFDDEEWRPVEKRFRGSDGELDAKAFSRFLRHLLLTEGDYINKADTMRAFKERYVAGGDFAPRKLAATLRRYARLYDYLQGGREHPSELVASAIGMVRRLGTTTAFPLGLRLLDLLDRGETSDRKVAEALRRVAGFVYRRKITGQASTGYVRWFPSACEDEHLRHQDGLVAGLTAFLKEKGYPSDEPFKSAFAQYELFRSDYKRITLEALERSYPHRERADLSQTEVEHVMPQTLTPEWREDLGPGSDPERLHDRLVHVPGNLSLSAYNGELSNSSFAEKRHEYERSNVVLTRHLSDLSRWGAEEIEARSRALAQQAAEIWVGPPFAKDRAVQ